MTMNPTPPAMSEQPNLIDPRVAPQPAPVETPTVRSELLPCPFCGEPPEIADPYEPTVARCNGHTIWMQFEDWNRRAGLRTMTRQQKEPVAQRTASQSTQPPPQPAAEERARREILTDAEISAWNAYNTEGGWGHEPMARGIFLDGFRAATLRPSPVDAGGVITDRAKKVAAEIVAHYDSGFIYELGRSGLETAKWLISKRIQEAIDAAPLATAGVSDGERDTQRLDWMASHNIRITKPDDAPPWIGPISASGEYIRDAIDAAMTAANQPAMSDPGQEGAGL